VAGQPSSSEKVQPITAAFSSTPTIVVPTEAERDFLQLYIEEQQATEEVDKTDAALYTVAKQYGVTLDENLSESRKRVLKAAFAGVIEHIPYYYTWRQYRVFTGISVNDFGTTLDRSDPRGRNAKGLDCSGFVCWAYYTAGIEQSGFAVTGDRESGYIFMATPAMRSASSTTEIQAKDLKSGDIGFISNSAWGISDHTGIYLGTNAAGDRVWLHCSGSQGAVCNTYNGFQVFYTVAGLET